jgi:hypothetical protein
METIKETKRLTRLSFLYPLSYLIPCSLVLIFAPKFLLDNFSNGNYSIFMTRLAGAAMLGFTIMVFSVFYFRVEAIYDVVIFVRLPVMAVVTWLYIDTHDPLFLILLITVLPGVVFSSIAKSIDKKRQIKIQN